MLARDLTREQRVLAEILEVAPAPRVAREVDAARQHHVEPLRPRLRADHPAAIVGQRRREAGGGGQARGQGGGGVALALLNLVGDAERRVGLADQRDAEPRHAVDVPRRGDQLVRGLARRHRREEAVDEADLLGLRHPRDDRLSACARGRALLRVGDDRGDDRRGEHGRAEQQDGEAAGHGMSSRPPSAALLCPGCHILLAFTTTPASLRHINLIDLDSISAAYE